MKLKQLTLALAVAAAASLAHAGTVVRINPDAAGADRILNVGSLDWAAGNSIAIPVQVKSDNAADLVEGDTIQTYAHSKLSSFLDSNGDPIGSISLNSLYEWTFVAAFMEEVIAVSGPIGAATATFNVINGGDNFFKIFYDTANNGNSLSGKNFADGTLILEGTVLPFNPTTTRGSTSFTARGVDATNPNFDRFGVDNYNQIDSVTGNGGGVLEVKVTYADPNFFIDGLPSVMLAFFDTQINIPYTQNNPSSCFWNGSAYINGAGPYNNAPAGTPLGCDTNTVGSINGISGPNVMFMTDPTTSFEGVPEPATLALLGLGLAGLGFSLRRRTA